MNAQQLFDIVKDLPREAWPELKYSEYPVSNYPMWSENGRAIADWLAVLAFESSLTRWLIGQGFHRFEWSHNSDTDKVILDLYGNAFVATTLIEALAAAVREGSKS